MVEPIAVLTSPGMETKFKRLSLRLFIDSPDNTVIRIANTDNMIDDIVDAKLIKDTKDSQVQN